VSAVDGFYARCGICRKDLVAGKWKIPKDPSVLGYVCRKKCSRR